MGDKPLDESKESNLTEGAFLISRSIDRSEVWFMPPIYLKAWIWMIKRANHQEIKQGDFVYCRGEFFTTYEEIRESLRYYEKHRKIKLSLKQSRIILDWFIANGMIEKTPVKRTLKLTTTSPLPHHTAQKIGSEKADVRAYLGLKIHIINYDPYQNLENYRGRPKGRPQEKAKGRGGAEVGHYNKNENNEKNLKNIECNDFERLEAFLSSLPEFQLFFLESKELIQEFINKVRESNKTKVIQGGRVFDLIGQLKGIQERTDAESLVMGLKKVFKKSEKDGFDFKKRDPTGYVWSVAKSHKAEKDKNTLLASALKEREYLLKTPGGEIFQELSSLAEGKL